MVAPTQRGYHDPSLRRPYPRGGAAPVEEESLALKRGDKGVPQFLGSVEDLGRHNMHLYSPLHDFYTGEGYNRDRSWDTGIQGVAMQGSQPDRYAPGINPFLGSPPFRGMPVGPPVAPLYGPQMAPDTSEARREVGVMNSPYTLNTRNSRTQTEVDATNRALQRVRSPTALDNFMNWLQSALTFQGGQRNQNYLDSALK
jgi:hypothetical protein